MNRRQLRGRRFYLRELAPGDFLAPGVLWIAWDKFERVSGVASSWAMAEAAIEHFRDAQHTYTLATRPVAR